jgi:phthiodiolone/phenolphthiodiolone dimycocerosates ketoreductase
MTVKFGWYPTSIWHSPDEVVRYAVIAEKSGFSSVWHNDHSVLCPAPPSTEKDLTPDVYVILSTIAAKTKKIMMGPGVSDPFRRHAFIIAQTIATLDYLSNGRALLGIGAGHPDLLSPFGIKVVHSMQRLREAVELMKILWTKKEPDFSGKFYKLQFSAPLYPNLCSAIVQKPHPPIYIGSLSGKKMREMTGEVAQGYFPYLCPPRLYSKWMEDIKRGAERGGRSFNDIDTCAFVNVALSDDYSIAKKEAEKLKESVVGYSYLFGSELGYEPINAGARYESVSKAKEAPFELVEELTAIGSAEDCIEKIEEYVEAGAKHIVIRKVTPKGYEKIFRIFKEKIIPHFSE